MSAVTSEATAEELGATSTSASQPVRRGPLRNVASAELAECTCPEWCERDHECD